MYIPAFWCGVAAVVIIEVVAIIGIAIFGPKKTKSKEENSHE